MDRILHRLTLLSAMVGIITGAGFSQRVYMTGDSHVSARFYPEEVKEFVEREMPGVEFSHWGKGGAGFYTFNETAEYMDSIYTASPDILLVHLGTNGCYNVEFEPEKARADMDTFYTNVKEKLPECKIVFVTPFYNMNRDIISADEEEREYGPWKVNGKTRECSDVIVSFAETHADAYVIDNNADAGTVFLDNEGLIRPDNIHLTEEGYHLLGRQVAQRLVSIEELWR